MREDKKREVGKEKESQHHGPAFSRWGFREVIMEAKSAFDGKNADTEQDAEN
ncbi:hypothetical protein MTBBW1_50038 [Desulfamplus magnetovallimortis]|uniref:Uncharacterized protein n=1 Tax=Desulfamplus magnetovallimortis TaxID=1246637 RepID=A0A1W1HHL5_9BACT|nr:hypothetical protein MTBBW1_50038 [Desulfamplus magnetovallimortis]